MTRLTLALALALALPCAAQAQTTTDAAKADGKAFGTEIGAAAQSAATDAAVPDLRRPLALWQARRLPVTQAARATAGGIMRVALSGALPALRGRH